ncbi:MAG TPA: acetyltransferase, partial [Candidatus Dormibacteraeota bacterium]
ADPPGGVTAIGDSVMLGASSALRAAIPSIEVDAVVSRQWDPGVATVQSDRSSGRLRPTLVVDLGTNGTVSAAQFDAMVRAATGTRRIVFVTVRVPRSWEASVNATLRAGVARYPGAVLADWYAATAGHPEWFGPDGYHLQPAGARALAALIAGAV